MHFSVTSRIQGFTLTELIMLIVIIAVMAATVLPKFMNLGQEARIASVKGTLDAVKAAAELGAQKCRVTQGCATNNTGTLISTSDGISGKMFNGYPTGTSRLPSYFGIKDWITVSGYTVVELNNNEAEFRLTSAPDPTNCKVYYREVAVFGASPIYTASFSGC